MIYSAVLQLAAQNASAKQILALKAAQSEFKEALQGRDIATRALANRQFHEITGEMAGNTYLLPSFKRLLIDHTRCLLYTSPSPRDRQKSRMPSSA